MISERKLQRKLNLSRWPGAKNLPEVWIERETVGKIEIYEVEKIERFGAKLEAARFGESDQF